MILSFLQFLRESYNVGNMRGSFWYNSNTGEVHNLDGGPEGIEPATYHAGFVANNPHVFGITRDEMLHAIQAHNKEIGLRDTPESAERILHLVSTGYSDTNGGLDNLVMSKGFVRVHSSVGGGLYTQGHNSALHKLAREVHRNYPDITSIKMDVHNAPQLYGAQDPTIRGMAHVLEGRDDIEQFVTSGGAPNRRYTRIIRVNAQKPVTTG